MNELLPCPFCGKNNGLTLELTPSETTRHFVMCTDCGAEGPYDLGESGAIESWNTRPTEDALKTELEQQGWVNVKDRLPDSACLNVMTCKPEENIEGCWEYEYENCYLPIEGAWGKGEGWTHWWLMPAAPEAHQ
jgi:Lar family restriction alleviation protein